FIGITSLASNIISGYILPSTTVLGNVFVFDRLTMRPTLLSHANAAPTKSGNAQSGIPVFGTDGSLVYYLSLAGDLVTGDYNNNYDIFAYITPPPRVASIQINDGSAQRSMVKSITIAFDEPVFFNGDPASAFTLTRNGSTGSVQLAVSSISNNPNGSI